MHPLGTSWLTNPEAARIQPGANSRPFSSYASRHLKAGTPRCGIVHRLDRQTSGALVVAKDPETYRPWSAFKEARRKRTARWCAACQRLSVGPHRPGGGQPASSSRRWAERRNLLQALEEEGRARRSCHHRPHQIARGYIGHPVMGDLSSTACARQGGPGAHDAPCLAPGFRASANGGRPFAEPPADFKRFWSPALKPGNASPSGFRRQAGTR